MPSMYELKKALLYPRTLYMRKKEAHLDGFIRSALDLHYYRPTFYNFIAASVEKPDLLHDINIDKDSIVLDIGAYIGDWARVIFDRYQCKIHAFEPNPETLPRLLARANGEWECHDYGVSGATEELQMSMNGMGSSVFDLGSSDKNPEYKSVQLRAIDEVWSDLGYGDVDLMKINIEGGEFPLLEKMITTDLLPKVRIFMIQFHEWHPGAYVRRWKIRRELRKTHVQRWGYHFIWEYWERKDS
ncbi:MAG: FkbM family methyltransferase [Pseudomonadota bacterium]